MISIIAAIGKNRELGKDNRLLWSIPEDLKRFKALTQSHIVIMGRKTFESLPIKPLPHRINIVVTRNKNFYYPNILIYNDLYEVIDKFKNQLEEVFIIGGQSIYQQAIEIVDKLYLTLIDKSFPEADAYFPEYQDKFKIIKKKTIKYQNYQITFTELIRK